MDRSSLLPIGLHSQSHDNYLGVNSLNSLKPKVQANSCNRSQSLKKFQQSRPKLSNIKTKQTDELPDIRKNSKSFREVPGTSYVRTRRFSKQPMQLMSKTGAVIAKGDGLLMQKASRKDKRPEIIFTSMACKSSRHRDDKYEFEPLSKGKKEKLVHLRTLSQTEVMQSLEDPYHYSNVACLSTSTPFKEILHSKSNKDSSLISSFDRLLKTRRTLGTSLNTSSRQFEASPLRSASRTGDVQDHETGWTSKRAAALFSRDLSFSPDFLRLKPKLTQFSVRRPDKAKLLIVINFEGVLGSLIRRDNTIQVRMRYQGIQALKYLQEYFDVVMVTSLDQNLLEQINKRLVKSKVYLTGIFRSSESTDTPVLVNYSYVLQSMMSSWRPTIVVSASTMALEELDSGALHMASGLSFNLNAKCLPVSEKSEHTPSSLIVPHLQAESPNESVSAYMFARALYDLAYKTSSNVDWRHNLEYLYNKNEPLLRCSFTSYLQIIKTDVVYEKLIETQCPPIAKSEEFNLNVKRPSFPNNYYAVLQLNHRTQRGPVENVAEKDGKAWEWQL